METTDVDVAVVGAGLAGLAAATALTDAGRSVAVVEARERVGGRLCSGRLGGGVVVDLGGAWMGAGHTRLARLTDRLGLRTFAQHVDGDNLLMLGERQRRYSGTIPKLSPLILLDVIRARRKLDRLARRISVERPWEAPAANELDAQTFDMWLRRHTRARTTRELLAIAGRTVWGTDPDELSLLHVLFYVRSAGGLDALFDTEGGAQQDRFVDGAQALCLHLAESLGEAVHLGRPAEWVAQDDAAVRVEGGGLTVRARQVVVAIPPALLARIEFEPALPAGRRQLAHRMPLGTLTKCLALYETPFWRDAGLSGEAITDAGPVTLTFDASPADGAAGVLVGFVGGPDARAFSCLDAAERRRAALAGFAALFGDRAREPADYAEQAWAEEPWSQGGPTSNFGPGGWTSFGPWLREPFGRVHWAGTETATVGNGYMEGALQSAERVVAELVEGRVVPSRTSAA